MDYQIIEVAKEMSQHVQFNALSIFLAVGAAIISICIALVAWLAIHGPVLVPGQDTRITAIIISSGSRLVWLIISTAIFRCAWASLLPRVLSGSYIPVWSLLAACQSFMSLGQLGNFWFLPGWFKFYLGLALTIAVAMIGTSSSFRYESLSLSGPATASVPDVAVICNASLISGGGYFCTGNPNYTDWNTNTTRNSWSYIDEVNSGGQGTVRKYGQIGNSELGSNVTLAILPSGWSLGLNNLPWMSISVSCFNLPISAAFKGTGMEATTTIVVNGSAIATLDITNMPGWVGVVQMYQQSNESGPLSSLAPWKFVMLSRDLNDGSSNFVGVAGDTVTYLGNGFVDLYGYGPILQGILGAAAYCEFTGDVGGDWPNILWPPLNHTTNVVFGPVINDRPSVSTVVLNYGPSWQYSPPGGNSIPYIANITGPEGTFASLCAAYIRNQWTLMAYSLARQTGDQLPATFTGSGPNRLYISVTDIVVLPLFGLGLGLLVTVYAVISNFRHRRWVNRVEFESWWLVKALSPELYRPGYGNATEKDLRNACRGYRVSYQDSSPEQQDVGYLRLCSAAPGEEDIEVEGIENISHRAFA